MPVEHRPGPDANVDSLKTLLLLQRIGVKSPKGRSKLSSQSSLEEVSRSTLL